MRFGLKPVVGALVLVGVYAAAGYVGVPAAVRWAVNNIVPEALSGRTAAVGDVSFNPWNWTLTVENFTVNSAGNPKQHMIELDRAVVDASFSTLTNMAPVLDAVDVDGLRVQLTASDLNNAEAQKAVAGSNAKDASASGGLPAFSLSNVSVRNSSVRLVSPKNNAEVNITDINFALPVISTLEATGSSSLAPALSLKINGKPVTAEGSMQGENASLSLHLADLDAAQLLKAAPVTIPYDVRSAKLSSALSLAFHLPRSGTPSFTASGVTTISDLDAYTEHGAPFARVKSATVSIGKLDLAAQSVDVKSVAVADPEIALVINSKSASDGDGGGKPAAAAPADKSSGASPAASAWKWSLAELSLTGGKVKLTDQGASPATTLTVTEIKLAAKNFSSKTNASGTYDFSARTAGGTLASAGTLSIDPLALKASTNVKTLALSSFNPWVKAFTGFSIPKGAADVAGTLDFKSGDKMSVSWKGRAAVSDLRALDSKGAELAALKSASVDVGLFDLARREVAINSVTATAPSLHAVFDSQITQAAKKTDAKGKDTKAQQPQKAAGAGEPAWNWSVKSASIQSGAVTLRDTGLKPAQTLSVSKIALQAANFSSKKGSTGTFKASASINGGRIESDGKLTLSPLALDASTNVSALGFAGFNPWIKALSGAQLTKGTADVMGRVHLKSDKSLALSWKGDLAVDNFEAKNAQGKTLMTWKQVTGNGIELASIDPLSVRVAELTVKEPAQKAVKTTSTLLGLFGSIAEATGHENTARRLGKAEQAVTQDITLRNLNYVDGRFSLGAKGHDPLQALVLDALNSVFTRRSGSY